MANIWARKSIAALEAEAAESETQFLTTHDGVPLKRTLTAVNLVSLGVGAIIGAGIFVLTGHAAAANAGPAIALSFVLGAFACAFAGLCYAEMASTVPIAGGAYTYAYATMGEITLFAFAILCLGVLVLRIKEPNLSRSFKAPAVDIIAPLGAASSLFLMFGLPLDTWLRFGVWLLIGLLIYGFYSVRHGGGAGRQSSASRAS